MPKHTFPQIIDRLHNMTNHGINPDTFLHDFLLAFGRSPSSVTQLCNGTIDKDPDDHSTRLQKGIIYFKACSSEISLAQEGKTLTRSPLASTYHPRFIFVTDYKTFVARDLMRNEVISDSLIHLDNHVEFFYPLTGDEFSSETHSATVTDYLAAGRVKYLYDELCQANLAQFEDYRLDFRHELNLFFGRLLLCLFAEDLGIFAPGQFAHAIATQTTVDAKHMDVFFQKLFLEVSTPNDTSEKSFPYIRSDLFDLNSHTGIIPQFTPHARYLLLRLTELDWSHINPDIFGTIFQNIIDQNRRSERGMDYTSVANIEKLLHPLFLDQLQQQFAIAKDNPEDLRLLWRRISAIKVFDPACGSGNFLIVAYKKLCALERSILIRLRELGSLSDEETFSHIKLSNFYGIELEDLPVILARVSMFVAERQTYSGLEKIFPNLKQQLNIRSTISNPQIFCGNAIRIDWQKVCPNQQRIVPGNIGIMSDQTHAVYDEIYLVGNPPYKGAKRQTASMKSDFSFYFGDEEYSRNLDYISLWFLKGARYISGTRARLAFVSTNSLCQGEHAALLFSKIFAENVEINFAHTSFRWQNNADKNAVVTVVIVGLANRDASPKKLFINDSAQNVTHINSYLLPTDSVIVAKRTTPIAPDLPEMFLGSQPIDGGHLILSEDEYQDLLRAYPVAKPFLHPFVGGNEYINCKKRFCILVDDQDFSVADRISALHQRFLQVKAYREHASCKSLANLPYKFAKLRHRGSPSLIIPRISSEFRDYIPIGIVDATTVISDGAQFIEDPELWLFAILTSRMHMAWARLLSGRLETRLRYSSTLVYNTFPLPPLTTLQKTALTRSAEQILAVREQYSELPFSELYDPARMPDDLREAHHQNDIVVDQIFGGEFASDRNRLSELFCRYAEYSSYQPK